MASGLMGFLIIVVLLFVVLGGGGGLLSGGSPLLFVAAGVLAAIFIPAFRRLAIGLVVLAYLSSLAYSAINERYQVAKGQVAAAAAAPASVGGAVETWVRGLVAEDWQPFIAGSTWQSTLGLSRSPCCIQPGDVQQGHLGDCWLLASLAAVAKTHPGVIEQAIQPNGDGTYTVTLYPTQNGKMVKREIRVTPEFPEYQTTIWQRLGLSTNESRFPYAQPGDDHEEAWVMLFEKAAATVLGQYEALDAGSGLAGLQMVTGNKADWFEPRKLTPDALAARLVELERANAPVTAGTFPGKQIVEAGPNPLLVGNEDDATLSLEHLYYFIRYDPAAKMVTVGNQHTRGEPTELTLQEFQFAFTAVFYTTLMPSTAGCPCQ